MWTNDYGNAIARWKVELIAERARKLGFRRHDLEDVQQEVILEVLAFEYDVSRCNGATECTALTSLIDRQLMAILRSKQRYADRIANLAPKPETDESQEVERQQRVLDVQDAVAHLCPEDQELCLALCEGDTITAFARRKDLSWYSVNERAVRIRKEFEQLGLGGWVGE